MGELPAYLATDVLVDCKMCFAFPASVHLSSCQIDSMALRHRAALMVVRCMPANLMLDCRIGPVDNIVRTILVP